MDIFFCDNEIYFWEKKSQLLFISFLMHHLFIAWTNNY